MAEMPGMIRPDLQALPQVRDRMTFLYLELAQACGHAGVILELLRRRMNDGAFPRIRGGDPKRYNIDQKNGNFSPHTRG